MNRERVRSQQRVAKVLTELRVNGDATDANEFVDRDVDLRVLLELLESIENAIRRNVVVIQEGPHREVIDRMKVGRRDDDVRTHNLTDSAHEMGEWNT